MANPDSERRAREFEIDQVCAEYVDAIEAGRHFDVKDYLARYPRYAAELADFIVSYHLTLTDLPELDQTPVAELSAGSARALEIVRAEIEQRIAGQEPQTALTGLEDRSFDAGIDPDQLAERVGVSPTIIARLDARAIAATSIPRELFRRLADALDVRIETVMAFLGASVQTGGAFFHADQAPTGGQDDFLAAIEASEDLDPARKAEWRQISASERGE